MQSVSWSRSAARLPFVMVFAGQTAHTVVPTVEAYVLRPQTPQALLILTALAVPTGQRLQPLVELRPKPDRQRSHALPAKPGKQ
jgi:hypothetical protein